MDRITMYVDFKSSVDKQTAETQLNDIFKEFGAGFITASGTGTIKIMDVTTEIVAAIEDLPTVEYVGLA